MAKDPTAAALKRLSSGSPSQGCASCDECKKWLSEVEKEAQKHSAEADDHKRNKNITQAYNDLYKDDPNNKWIGLAGNVSAQVGCSMNGFMRNTSGMTAALGDGNKTIFNNIYPMALFHKRHGLEAMKKCYGNDLPDKMKEAFEAMDGGNPQDKRKAANKIADYEQRDVVPQVYSAHPMTLGFMAGNAPNSYVSIPVSQTCGASPVIPFKGDIGNQDDRYEYANSLMNEFERQQK